MNDSPELRRLERAYKKEGRWDAFGLFLGAGVNLRLEGDERRYPFRTFGWKELLEEVHKRNRDPQRPAFDTLWRKHQLWPNRATAVRGSLSERQLARRIDRIIYAGIPRSDKYGRLSRRVLAYAPTLHAAICFASEIKNKTATSWTFRRNPRIGLVVTSNYDYFFGAGWTGYQGFENTWKVQTPCSKREPEQERRPICYVHGYLPYKPGRSEGLVLTRETYNDAYAPGGFAYETLREATSKHNLIFLGVSFEDGALCRILEKTRGSRRHFVVTRAGSAAARRAKRLGITVVPVDDYGEVASVLERVYLAALDRRECRRVQLAPTEYWPRLLKGPVK